MEFKYSIAQKAEMPLKQCLKALLYHSFRRL